MTRYQHNLIAGNLDVEKNSPKHAPNHHLIAMTAISQKKSLSRHRIPRQMQQVGATTGRSTPTQTYRDVGNGGKARETIEDKPSGRQMLVLMLRGRRSR